MNYRIIRSMPELLRLKQDWRRLLRPEASPFSTFAWNVEWLRLYRDRCDEILVFAICSDYRVRAIVPLYRSGNRLRFVGDEICDFQDVIAEDEESGEKAIAMVVEYASANKLELYAPKIVSNTLAYKLFNGSVEQSEPCCWSRRQDGPVPFMELDGSWEQFSGNLSTNLREDVRKQGARMRRELGEVREEFFAGDAITDELISLIGKLHQQNPHGEKCGSLFGDERFGQMLRAVSRDPDAGLHVSLLKNGGPPMSFILGFLRNGTYYLFLTACEEAYENFSPCKVLIHSLVKHLMERGGVKVFDFLNGPEGFDSQWATKVHEVYQFGLEPGLAPGRTKTQAAG